MDCCTGDIINLGCYQSCDIVQIGINAPATGTYIIELVPDGRRIFSTENTIASPLIFSNGFGEDGISVFKIIKPDGTYLSIDGDNCFQIENSIALVPELRNTNVIPIPGGSCEYDVYVNGVFNQSVTLVNCEDLTITVP